MSDVISATGFEPVSVREDLGGYQAIWRFPNGYGASVVAHDYSYGVELGVVKFHNDYDDYDFELVYDTHIAQSVIGYISSSDELKGYLLQIEAL